MVNRVESLSNVHGSSIPALQVSAEPSDPSIVCRPVHREETASALRLIFSSGARPADVQVDAQVADFLEFADSRGIDAGDLWVAERRGRLLSAVLPIYSPGWTVLLMCPGELPHGRDRLAYEMLVESVCRAAAQRGTHLAQVLLEPIDQAVQNLFIGRGFRRMAELLYLQMNVKRRFALPLLPEGYRWLSYTPDTHAFFAAVISESYIDSLDCPGLNGLRHIEDVITSHKASGEFDPSLWYLLTTTISDGREVTEPVNACAVLLLSRLPRADSVELVYLGLSPWARGKGLGSLLMRQACGVVARSNQSRLTLAVDSANVPALKLYYRHGMKQVASRVALMRDLRFGR